MIKNWEKVLWGVQNKKDVFLFKFKNADGSYVEITNYGAIVKSIVVPDSSRIYKNVILDFQTLKGYQDDKCYLGATVGRVANRIDNATYLDNDQKIYLDKNDGIHQNHGGFDGFNRQVFDYEINEDVLILSLHSPSGSGGFPGNLFLQVHYKWTCKQELSIKYVARTSATTPLNITNHCYFNLSGIQSKIWNHILKVASNKILETTADYIPNGNIVPSKIIYASDELSLGANLLHSERVRGLNNYFITNSSSHKNNFKESPVCILYDQKSGRNLEIFTTYPGVQIYTGDFLDSQIDDTIFYKPHEGICLECQFYPDSPNHKHFPNILLKPTEIYEESIVYRFNSI